MKNFIFNNFNNINGINNGKLYCDEPAASLKNNELKISSLRISLRADCNEGCFYCHNEGIPSTMKSSLEIGDILNAIHSLKSLGLVKVKLTGGEPFLFKKLGELIYGIKHIGDIKIFITTNGTLIKKRISDISLGAIEKISVSLDTLDEKKYRMITGKNLLHEVLGGLKLLKERNYKVEIDCLLLKNVNNNKENIEDMIDYCSANNFNLQFIELSTLSAENIYKKYYIDPIKTFKKAGFDFRTDIYNDRKFIKYKNVKITLCRSVKNTALSSDGRCSGLRMLPNGQLRGFYYF